jgi:hypothetical protein
MRPPALILVAVAALPACAPAHLISLHQTIPVTVTPPGEIPLEVVTRSAAVHDPLPLDGTGSGFAGLEEALGHAVSTAAVPWADAHRALEPSGWQLIVELARAKASYSGGQIDVAVNVRATLRARGDHRYVAQTQAHCHEVAAASPHESAPVIYACLTAVGRELGGWLGAVQP